MVLPLGGGPREIWSVQLERVFPTVAATLEISGGRILVVVETLVVVGILIVMEMAVTSSWRDEDFMGLEVGRAGEGEGEGEEEEEEEEEEGVAGAGGSVGCVVEETSQVVCLDSILGEPPFIRALTN